jgi:threonine dehydratase
VSDFPGGSPVSLVTVEEIRAAAGRLDGVIVPTPLVPFPGIQPALLVKPESLQPIGSFKLRGAYAAISALPPAVRERGVVAHSSGNHAQAVAYAAALLGIPAVVVIPENAPAVKVAAVRRMGARIVPVQPTLTARVAAAEDLVSRHGFTLIPPFDHRAVIAGQGTIGLEIAAQCPEADLVVVPVGGGGLISGISAAIRGLCPRAKVIGVEPELAADARDSFRRGERVAWPAASTQRTIADSLRVEQVGALPLEHILRYVDDIVTVTEDEIREGVRRIAVEAHLIAEPGGAVAVAAWLLRKQDLPAARSPVAVLSGGNIDPGVLAGLLSSHGAREDPAGLPASGFSTPAVVRRGPLGVRTLASGQSSPGALQTPAVRVVEGSGEACVRRNSLCVPQSFTPPPGSCCLSSPPGSSILRARVDGCCLHLAWSSAESRVMCCCRASGTRCPGRWQARRAASGPGSTRARTPRTTTEVFRLGPF